MNTRAPKQTPKWMKDLEEKVKQEKVKLDDPKGKEKFTAVLKRIYKKG